MFFGCECFWWNRVSGELDPSEQQLFSLPSPLPQWPQGGRFAAGKIDLGEIEVVEITRFKSIWGSDSSSGEPSKGVTFYKPVGIPDGYFCLGDYCQPNDRPLTGYLLAARAHKAEIGGNEDGLLSERPALTQPLNYSLVWSTESDRYGGCYFWLPNPPVGYKAMGIIVTDEPNEPDPEEVRCVREDLTEKCEACDTVLNVDSSSFSGSFRVWSTRPCKRGVFGKGVSVGTFFCGTNDLVHETDLEIVCLKNLDSKLSAMPNLDQVHALIEHYGPTVFFHPDDFYLPSSVDWFFKNGALLYKFGNPKGKRIDHGGSNLPFGGENDGRFWIDLPDDDDTRDRLKKGNLDSAELYVHVKPALGGTFTDIAMWVFCPFNGPATIKIGLINVALNKIGEHVGDWEHFTLRVSNFTGELLQVYFSQHDGGEWVYVSGLEFVEGKKKNNFIVYSSKHGHASFPHSGMNLQGLLKLGVGLRNDTAKSEFSVDSSKKYKIVAAEYLGGGAVEEPCWLQYMREWGPTIVYDSRSEIEKIISHLPFFIKFSVEHIFDLLPTQVYGEEGPTGPKGKDNWFGDERW